VKKLLLGKIFPESEHFETASVVLWSEFLTTDQEVQVRFPELPDILFQKKVTAPVQKTENMALAIGHNNNVAHRIHKSRH
jgi:hypothetical protein